ncbi:uncharacterized protein LOC111803675 [Cucurbita pepo subsp. pepo]|uniref:uncharacterized protein LOC111803675 n=1 Tax=Cucurbita pepo subsp. pepo TaxID=3664 RepID=UPI000C9D7E16|nr:uncharacterized protein LOC111803675 [Cucurbita pepo subsp. pepo]
MEWFRHGPLRSFSAISDVRPQLDINLFLSLTWLYPKSRVHINICLPRQIVGTKGKYYYRLRNFILMKLRLFISMLQKSLSPLMSKEPKHDSFDEEFDAAVMVPKDVEEGHFVVFAADGDERKRFVINLKFLSNPAFLRLLELAKEEYGFQQKGALTVPCPPEELQKIVEERRKQKTGEWIASSVHIITGY